MSNINSKHNEHNLHWINIVILSSIIFILLSNIATIPFVFAQPGGATIVSNTTETAPATSAGSIATSGGTFTTLVLNATSQNIRWKAYVGNISGGLALQDANNDTIYDWTLATITGEVYASRNSSVIWTNVECANRSTITAEDSFLNMTAGNVDTINNTFNYTVHQTFFVGANTIQNSTCPAITTYINSSAQVVSETADFQEILLQSQGTLIYSTVLEDDAAAYSNSKTFDFQMIIAEDQFAGSPTTYYFYAELG